MKISKLRAVAALTLAAALTVGASATVASAATPSGSRGPFYLLDAGTGERMATGAPIAWNYDVVGSNIGSYDEELSKFAASSDATSVRTFISRVGEETNVSGWLAYKDDSYGADRKVFLPNIRPDAMILGNQAAVKAAGGTYSIGFAYLKNNNLTLADGGVTFTHMTVTAGTGAWTFEEPTTTTTPPTEPPAGSQTGTIDLEATTIAAQDGALSLVIPAGAKATLGTATLVNGISTSTGSLGHVTVKDGRVVSRPGWTLSTSVAAFTSGANSIEAKQLGVTPKVISTTAGGVTAGAAQTAGDSIWPATFGQASAANPVGDTVFDADLKFVAPASAPAGTYTSKMTLTLVSK